MRDLNAAQVTERLGGTEVARIIGLGRAERYRYAVDHPRGFALVADLPGGAVIVEVVLCRALFKDTNGPLSRGTSVAVVRESENNDPAFLWVVDGEVRVSFSPDTAGWRAAAARQERRLGAAVRADQGGRCTRPARRWTGRLRLRRRRRRRIRVREGQRSTLDGQCRRRPGRGSIR
ncbi:hypothetical protein Aca07nite_60360 [Actinoplanes capillaceus]|uniref:Cyclic nucleotide-binding domain-containing protein n=1 Tax=Actinoplanes campanulatus TaxID=113559 RepID=A0ABQ3WRF9_9ACTN|nr:hypothetical protein Aca07nite_60360 [Actinoplanes capillaceus]